MMLIFCLLSIAILIGGVYFLFSIYPFEILPIIALIGWEGLTFITLIMVGSLLPFFAVIAKYKKIKNHYLFKIFFCLWLILLAWSADWLLLEKPLSQMLFAKFNVFSKSEPHIDDEAVKLISNIFFNGQLSAFSSFKDFAVVLERIKYNRPQYYDHIKILNLIYLYSQQYSIDPVMLIYWLYLGSFYGEATSGKLPFIANMTSETFRDFIQVHLPSFFIESSIRQSLIQNGFGKSFFNMQECPKSWKIRYALHKATLDVSLEPYDVNIFSDILLILKEYRIEFPEVFLNENKEQLLLTIRDSFLNIQDMCIIKPYDQPYVIKKVDGNFYAKHRKEIKKFARAVFYKVLLDIEFATKIQSLIVKYYNDQYRQQLGNDIWENVSDNQKSVMLAILRDVYVPNVGKIGYNLYALPELNCTPFLYVVSHAADNIGYLTDKQKIWLPDNLDLLWGAGALKLNVLSEIFTLTGTPEPDIKSSKTINQARLLMYNQ